MNHTTGVANIFLELAHTHTVSQQMHCLKIKMCITNAMHTDCDLKTKKSCTCVVEILPHVPTAELLYKSDK